MPTPLSFTRSSQHKRTPLPIRQDHHTPENILSQNQTRKLSKIGAVNQDDSSKRSSDEAN